MNEPVKQEKAMSKEVEVINPESFHFEARGYSCTYWTNGMHIVREGSCRCGAEFILAMVRTENSEVSNG